MKTRPSATLIGIFVAGGVTLLVAAVFYFGARTWFAESREFMVYFDESVHGLEVGAPVKFRGVRLGRVSRIGVHYDADTARSRIAVACELDRQVMRDAAGNLIDMGDPEVLRQLVREGLRARLSLVGISGLMYIEMDYVDPAPPLPEAVETSPYAVVPAVQSAFADLRDSFAEITADIGSVDFEGISRRVEYLLDQAGAKVEALEVEAMAANLNEAAVAFIELIGSEGLQDSIRSADAAFNNLSTVLVRLEEQIDPVSERFVVTADELSVTLNKLGGAVEAIEGLVGPRSGIGPELATTLQRLGEASRSVQQLADYLERNPNALLSGRREAPQ